MLGNEAGKPKQSGQHVFSAGLAEFAAEVLIAVKDLLDDRLGRGRVDV